MFNTRIILEMFNIDSIELYYYSSTDDFFNNEKIMTVNDMKFKLELTNELGFGLIAQWINSEYVIRSCPYFDFQDGEALIPLYMEILDIDLNHICTIRSNKPVRSWYDYIKNTKELSEIVFLRDEIRIGMINKTIIQDQEGKIQITF